MKFKDKQGKEHEAFCPDCAKIACKLADEVGEQAYREVFEKIEKLIELNTNFDFELDMNEFAEDMDELKQKLCGGEKDGKS